MRLCPVQFLLYLFTIYLGPWRSCGRFPYSSRRSPSSRNCTCLNSLGKLKLSLATISLRLVYIVRCIFSIGSIGALASDSNNSQADTEQNFRFYTEGTIDPISVSGGIVQTCINFYFIYVYFRKYPSAIDIEFPPDASLPHSSVVIDDSDPQLPKAQPPTENQPSDIVDMPNAVSAAQVAPAAHSPPEHPADISAVV
jgi:hypothetical protein